MEGNYCTYVRHTSEQGEMGEAVAMDYKDLIEMVSPTKVISLRSIWWQLFQHSEMNNKKETPDKANYSILSVN